MDDLGSEGALTAIQAAQNLSGEQLSEKSPGILVVSGLSTSQQCTLTAETATASWTDRRTVRSSKTAIIVLLLIRSHI